MHRATRFAVAAAFVAATASTAAAQTSAPRTSAAAKSARAWTPPRTGWGDPDLQGSYSNTDESGTPFERPAEFAGKRLEDITPAELEKVIEARNTRKREVAPGLGGRETGAGPIHWFEDYNSKNSRAWLVTDPQDGKVPPQTDEARQRAAAASLKRRGGNGFDVGPFDGPEDLSLYDRCISRGIPGSMMPAIYGNSYQIVQGPGFVAIRYEMVHETRVIPLDSRPHVGKRIEMYMGDAARTLGGRHAGRRDDQLRRAGGVPRRLEKPEAHRTIQADRPEDGRLVGHARRSAHVDAALDVRDEPDERRHAAGVRVRVPRRQLRPPGDPERRARRGDKK